MLNFKYVRAPQQCALWLHVLCAANVNFYQLPRKYMQITSATRKTKKNISFLIYNYVDILQYKKTKLQMFAWRFYFNSAENSSYITLSECFAAMMSSMWEFVVFNRTNANRPTTPQLLYKMEVVFVIIN